MADKVIMDEDKIQGLQVALIELIEEHGRTSHEIVEHQDRESDTGTPEITLYKCQVVIDAESLRNHDITPEEAIMAYEDDPRGFEYDLSDLFTKELGDAGWPKDYTAFVKDGNVVFEFYEVF